MSSPISQGGWEEQIKLGDQSETIVRHMTAVLDEQVDQPK